MINILNWIMRLITFVLAGVCYRNMWMETDKEGLTKKDTWIVFLSYFVAACGMAYGWPVFLVGILIMLAIELIAHDEKESA